ncbi:hypothetical protein ABZ281_00055 [Streptomyces sp. NPDC006265]|uniref:hypothetical protein n=1 Tax=Streptomyces sp. NPDC006265 TaxID=3156740 RepID=UPI0033B6E0C2
MDGPDLGAIEERWAKALPGPYEFWLDEGSMAHVVTDDGRRIALVHGAYSLTAHALAHAPTDIRALLDEVRRLRRNDHDSAS